MPCLQSLNGTVARHVGLINIRYPGYPLLRGGEGEGMEVRDGSWEGGGMRGLGQCVRI